MMHKKVEKWKKQKLGSICIALGAAAVLVGVCGLLIKGYMGKDPTKGYLQPVRIGEEGGRRPLVTDGEESRQLTVYAENMQGLYNPAFAETIGDRLVSAAAFEPMMQQTGPDDWKPVLLEKAERTADGLTYVLYLKKGILFWDGTEMKSQDVCASILAYGMAGKEMGKAFACLSGFEEFLDDPDGEPGEVRYPEGVRPLDDYRVQLKFDKDSADNPLLLGVMVQKNTFLQNNQDGNAMERLNQICRSGMGTGAYQWTKEQEPGKEVILTANEHYRSKGKGAGTLLFLSPGAYETAELAGQGRIDIAVCGSSGTINHAFYSNESYSVYERPTEDCYCLRWGTGYETDETEAYRQAVEAALLPGIKEYGGDRQAAMQKTQESTSGVKGEAVLLIDKEDPKQTETAAYLKQTLDAAGLRLNIQPVSTQEYLQAVYERQEYELILANSTQSDVQAGGLIPLDYYKQAIYIIGDLKNIKVLCYGSFLENINHAVPKKRQGAWK